MDGQTSEIGSSRLKVGVGELGADLLNLDRNIDFCVVDFYVGVIWIINNNASVETVRVVG